MISDIEKLKIHLQKHIQFSEEELALIVSCFHYKKLNKKDFFLKVGQIPKYEAFVTAGLIRQFVLDVNGKEHTIYFAVEDWWISDVYAFLHQTPATIYIQAIEESEILIISKQDKLKLFDEIPAMERLFRIMTQKSHASLVQRMVDNLMKTADQRYIDYMTKYPHIAARLTNIQMATYLGISHEFVSKIRRKIASKK